MNRRIAVVVLAMLLPGEALTSGSSTVRAIGKHVAVTTSSPSVIFPDGDDGHEREWHTRWQEENQSYVDAVVPTIEAVVAKAAHGHKLKLAPFDDDLPEAWAWAEPADGDSPEQVCVNGCRVRLQPWDAGTGLRVPPYEVEVALAAPPKRGALKALNESLARALADDPPPE